ncbi:MAG: hypothetical protein KGI50_08070 [Patescibacteria group bacterium]|nr:hypothetical protein [Patescibacteria group bacterium]MDE1971501.1 hypothetical protein [Patescibacteria group bacterium]
MNKNDRNRKGGLARIRIHGNPGTDAGRRLGGLRAIVSHTASSGASCFKKLIKIPRLRYSSALAEAFGILAGDGHVGTYQISVTTNSQTDLEHAKYVRKLFRKLFKLRISFRLRKKQNACVIYVSSKKLCSTLGSMGLIQGDKIAAQLSIPIWIKQNRMYLHNFIRGLFDTDGCVYIDRHMIRGRSYAHLAISFTSRSLPLLSDFKHSLEQLGLHPTQKSKFAVFLRRREEINTYFAVVGSSNPKHLRKYRNFSKEAIRRGVRVV